MRQLYVFFITSCKKNSYKKMKITKKNSQSFYKIIMLIPIYTLAPIWKKLAPIWRQFFWSLKTCISKLPKFWVIEEIFFIFFSNDVQKTLGHSFVFINICNYLNINKVLRIGLWWNIWNILQNISKWDILRKIIFSQELYTCMEKLT